MHDIIEDFYSLDQYTESGMSFCQLVLATHIVCSLHENRVSLFACCVAVRSTYLIYFISAKKTSSFSRKEVRVRVQIEAWRSVCMRLGTPIP